MDYKDDGKYTMIGGTPMKKTTLVLIMAIMFFCIPIIGWPFSAICLLIWIASKLTGQ